MSLFFLMCSERCGSNFITKLLNGHENICGPSTKHIINPVARNLFRYNELTEERNWSELLVDIERLMNADFTVWKKRFDFSELKSLAPVGDIRALIENIFLAEARSHGKQHVFVKENHLYELVAFLLLTFPEARYVYLVRDPRDMALSWKKNPDHRGGIIAGARQWQKDQQQSLKNFHLLRGAGKAILVTYEDLISDTMEEIGRVIDFLGLPRDPNILDYHKDDTTRRNAEKHQAWANVARSVMTNNSRKFLKEMDPLEIKMVEKICYYEMRHLGYACEFDKAELDQITVESVDAYAKNEVEEIPHLVSNGVRENIEAKAGFYQR